MLVSVVAVVELLVVQHLEQSAVDQDAEAAVVHNKTGAAVA